ncbi:mlk-1 [Pristionchus pacificus]|nr:mlk-1 [Pristionchus pacificus]|eukprot:PDM81222.1 mlk-1 [Pristionchus pacificus]
MKNGETEAGFEDYVNMDHMGQPANVSKGRASRHSGIDDPMPFQPDAVRMRNNNGEDEQIYEICYDYKARQHDELDLRRGSVVKVVKDAETGWYQGLVDGKVGVFPKNYIRAIGRCNFKNIRASEIELSFLIGEGAAGQVYHANYHGKSVAFKKYKFIGREREREEDVIEKITYSVKREAAYFSNLRHENIVELYGVCLDSPTIGLVLELCQGGTLSQVYRKVTNAAVPKRILVDWAQQMCAAMEAISSKFVHRDLKMDNVLVLQKVCFCALPNGKSTPDRPNSDLYSHDKIQVLWELVTRKQPYEDVCKGNNATIPFFVAMGSFKLETTKEFPTAIASIIKSCLQMDPENRPKFRDIRHMLREYMEDLLRVNDPSEYIEQHKLEVAIMNDIAALKNAGALEEHFKISNNAPKPVERLPLHKKGLDKSQIGEPTAPRILFHIPPGGTLPRNLDHIDSSRVSDIWSHQPLKPTLSKSQPNLNQIHVSPQSKMSRDRLHGIRKKKEKVVDEVAGYDEYMRESSSNMDDHDSIGSPFSQSHDERPHSSMHSRGVEKRGSDGSVSFKGGRSTKEGHSKIEKIKKFFMGKREARSPAPRHSSVSVDSNEDHDHSVTPSRSQSMSSTMTSSALLYNTTRTPIDVGVLYGHEKKLQNGGKSPDRRTSNGVVEHSEERKRKNILPTHNTKTYTKISPMPHPSSSPAGMSNASYSPINNGYSATNSAYSTLSSAGGNSRPSGLSQQQPLYHPGSSNSSSNSNTPVGLDEQYPPGGGGVPDMAYTQLHPSSNIPHHRPPPELPPRRRHGEHFQPGLSTIVPVEQSSPTHMDMASLPSALRGRSRTVSGCTADSPVGCISVSSTPYIEMPSTAAVVANGGHMRGGRRDSSPDYIVNSSYEPYRSMARRLDSPISPPISDPPPLPPALPPKTHHSTHPSATTAAAAAEYLTLSSK